MDDTAFPEFVKQVFEKFPTLRAALDMEKFPLLVNDPRQTKALAQFFYPLDNLEPEKTLGVGSYNDKSTISFFVWMNKDETKAYVILKRIDIPSAPWFLLTNTGVYVAYIKKPAFAGKKKADFSEFDTSEDSNSSSVGPYSYGSGGGKRQIRATSPFS